MRVYVCVWVPALKWTVWRRRSRAYIREPTGLNNWRSVCMRERGSEYERKRRRGEREFDLLPSWLWATGQSRSRRSFRVFPPTHTHSAGLTNRVVLIFNDTELVSIHRTDIKKFWKLRSLFHHFLSPYSHSHSLSLFLSLYFSLFRTHFLSLLLFVIITFSLSHTHIRYTQNELGRAHRQSEEGEEPVRGRNIGGELALEKGFAHTRTHTLTRSLSLILFSLSSHAHPRSSRLLRGRL